MQGLWIYADQFQRIVPWWEPVITSPQVTLADRLRSYSAKQAEGDECQILPLSWNYQAPGLLAPFEGRDLWRDIPTFKKYVVEALTVGKMKSILAMLGGDGLDYNADGGTYGYENLMAEFPRIWRELGPTSSEKDIREYIAPCPGFDGVVPGWAGPQDQWGRVEQWLLLARYIVGNRIVLPLELSAGYWCWTEEDRYSSLGGQCLDVVLYEFPYPFGPTTMAVPDDFCRQSDDVRRPFDQVWQISNRLLGPDYRRPPDQPACDDPNPQPGPGGTPRGPLYKIPFETNTYGFVRGYDDLHAVNVDRNYQRSIGWSHIR